MCNLSEIHLNRIDARNLEEQIDAFKAGALIVSTFLHHKFDRPILQKSRELDPIVGVSFTGLFDFFVQGLGVKWLQWWEAGRPEFYEGKLIDPAIEAICAMHKIEIDDYETAQGTGWNFGLLYRAIEKEYLSSWRRIVEDTVRDYCERHGLRCPNRCTTVQPAGCLTKDAVRIFDRGLLFADEHMEPGSGEIDLTSEKLAVRDGIPVRSGIANKKLDLIRISLKNGRQLTMTPNHRLSINGKWVEAKDMVIGQTVDIELGKYTNDKEPSLFSFKPNERVKRFPTAMSPDLAYFMGALFTDSGFYGSTANGLVVRFRNLGLKILGKLSLIAETLFGWSGEITLDYESSSLEFVDDDFYKWFAVNNLRKPSKAIESDERMPRILRLASKESLLAFFTGLIDASGGCIRLKEYDNYVFIDLKSPELIEHLQQVAEAVGLCFTRGSHEMRLRPIWSKKESLEALEKHSISIEPGALLSVRRSLSFHPYDISAIENGIYDYTYDYAVEGENDDDSWYWQGAIKSHNTKSLLTGASPGWHPPKSSLFIRRITVTKNSPIGLAAIDCGYSVVPSQSDKDENGRLLSDPFDDRCTEWLIQVPTATVWAMWPGVQDIDISKFSAAAQFDFYMQVQRHWTMHNTSATLEVRGNEVEELGQKIFEAIQNNEGYVSAAIMARFDDYQSHPLLPFEPVSRETYDRLCQEILERRTCNDFYEALSKYTSTEEAEGPAPCDSDKCLMPPTNK